MKHPLIIIGGMGPQASLELHRLIVEKSAELSSLPSEFPNILHASIAVPDFISSADATRQAAQQINDTCSILPLEQAAAIGLACNTAHFLIDDIPGLGTKNFISMIDAVCSGVMELGVGSVGLLASPFTIEQKLYESPLRTRGIDVLTPSPNGVLELGKLIRSVISGANPRGLRERLTNLALDLQKEGAECIILGCTELPLIGVDCSLPTINSLEALAAVMTKRHIDSRMI